MQKSKSEKTKEFTETKRISIKGLPIKLRQKIKIQSIKENITMEKMIVNILENYIAKA